MMVLNVARTVGSTVRAVLIAVLAGGAPWVVSRELVPEETIGWHPWAMAAALTFFLGRTLRRQRVLIHELREARHALANEAVAEERRRIAREVHDLAGHTLAAMVLHVTGARHVLRRDVDDAEQALLDAETVGRSSLDQVRATVAALRDHERGTDPALAGAADIPALVEDYRRAGLTITTEIGAGAATIGGPTGTALHRITGEALANVAFHARGNQVALELAATDEEAARHRRSRAGRSGDRSRPTALRPSRHGRTLPGPRWGARSRSDVRRLAGRGEAPQRQRRQAVTSS